jgi:serine/threonine-protein kinase
MGVVYLAEHRHMGRRAAIKFLMPELSQMGDRLQRFFLEARAASMVEHDGIVRVFDCDVHPNGSAYIVMEYLAGQNLQAFLAIRRALPPSEAAAVMLPVASALAAAHDKGIVHRDLKPENIFVLSHPPGGIKILDFGVAKLSQSVHNEPSRTQSGALLGTPLYMSPEQARGSATVDARADVYSMGCILFEMLTGQPPFTHLSSNELLLAHMGQPPPPLDPSIPAALRVLVAGMLAKEPGERPTVREGVIPILQSVITGRPVEGVPAVTAVLPPQGHVSPVESYAPPSTPMPSLDQKPERSRTGAVALLAVLAMLGGGALWWLRREGTGPVAATADPAAAPSATGAGAPALERTKAETISENADVNAMANAGTKPAPGPAPAPPGQDPAVAEGIATSRRSPAPRGRTRARTAGKSPGKLAARAESAAGLRVELTSEPAGSLVCLPNVASRVGLTNGTVDLGARERATVILYHPGFHLERVTLASAEARTVKLRPLNEDDLAPPPPCR